VVFYEPKAVYRAFKEDVPDEPETMEIGKAKVVREGSDVTLFPTARDAAGAGSRG
jgi:pyruvate dehydrogenase E1 component beta subunit